MEKDANTQYIHKIALIWYKLYLYLLTLYVYDMMMVMEENSGDRNEFRQPIVPQ